MKKIMLFMLLLSVLLSACSCSNSTSTQPSSDFYEGFYETTENDDTEINNEQNFQTECSHNWIAANCTSPKKCSICNVTEGSPKGHNWSGRTCQSPQKCKNCGVTQGDVGSCKDNGKGKCKYCGKDLYLENIKNNLTVQLIIPRSGTDNCYFTIKYVNHTGSTIVLDEYASANGYLCNGPQADKFELSNNYEVSTGYYRSVIWEDRFDDRYYDMYLDSSSLGYTNIEINGKTIFIRFGTSGITQVGYSLNEIGVY